MLEQVCDGVSGQRDLLEDIRLSVLKPVHQSAHIVLTFFHNFLKVYERHWSMGL
jgi:hypothetical protein